MSQNKKKTDADLDVKLVTRVGFSLHWKKARDFFGRDFGRDFCGILRSSVF